MSAPKSPVDPKELRGKNLRLALILASIAMAVFVGFLIKYAVLKP